MTDRLRGIVDAARTALLWCALGFIGGYAVGNPPRKLPAPGPITRPAPAHHAGHLYLSYIEPRYGSPTSAAVRDALAAVDWKPLDCTFRSYEEGQDELKTLGFTKHFTSSDLPVLFIQESGPKGAPIIDAPIRSPGSAAAVLDRVKELRGP